jgi:hypothetical protein
MDEFVALSRTRPPWFKVLPFTSLAKTSNIVSICACLKERIKLVLFYAKCYASTSIVIKLLKFIVVKLLRT